MIPRPAEIELFPGAFDEMVTGIGAVRTHWRGLLGAISALPRGALTERAERARHQFAENGVTYNIYADPRAADRPYRFDLVPLVLDAEEWEQLEIGLAQRAQLLEAILADAYGAQELPLSGAYPAALLYANPQFLRAARWSLGAGRRHIGLYVADLLRAPDGSWQVLADRVDRPAGLGYALENRRILSRVFPEGFRAAAIRPLRPFFELWQSALADAALLASANPRIVLLTPGPQSETYFEHIYLARELGFGLVEGADLTARGGRLFLKTLGGLQQVDVVYRRIDAALCDPLELDGASAFGVAGMMDAVRSGSLTVVNALGCALVETPALGGYLPGLCEGLLNESLKLPSVAREWLGIEGAWSKIAQSMDGMIIRETWNTRETPKIVSRLGPAERADLIRAIEANPSRFTAQPMMSPSVTPTWTPSGLQPKPVILRCFVIADGQGYTVLPGGYARVPGDDNPFVGSLHRGGLAKDVWIQARDRSAIAVPGPPSVPELELRRTSGELPSRVADNLYWFGRYGERLDVSARILRTALLRLIGGGLGARDMLELGVLAKLAAECGLIDRTAAMSQPDSRVLASALTDHAVLSSLVDVFARLEQLVTPIRDRFSGDMWSTLSHLLHQSREGLMQAAGNPDQLLGALTDLLRDIAAVNGMGSENMTRGTGWRFWDLGRRIERAIQTLDAIDFVLNHENAVGDSALILILELCDSMITYRTRYLSALQPGLVLDLVLADDTNPRSVAFQLAQMAVHLHNVPATRDENPPDLELIEQSMTAIAAPDYAALRHMNDLNPLKPMFDDLARKLQSASDALVRRNFTHVTTSQAYVYEQGP